MMTGRLASRSISLARSNASTGGAIAGAATRPSGVPAGASSSARIVCTSSGNTTCDTSRWISACLQARLINSAWFDPGNAVWLNPATALNASVNGNS